MSNKNFTFQNRRPLPKRAFFYFHKSPPFSIPPFKGGIDWLNVKYLLLNIDIIFSPFSLLLSAD